MQSMRDDVRFELGETAITAAALEILSDGDIRRGLDRHASGDWGDVPPDDAVSNETALRVGGRLFSAYDSKEGARFWILTEADRSTTTILLPQDY